MTVDNKQSKEKAIRDGGFYGSNGLWNSIITFPGDKNLYRNRVETLIVKDNKFVFVKKKVSGEYYLPGGSTEKDIPNIEQAVNECREEAHINVRNIQSTGITYKKIYGTPPAYIKKYSNIEWQGLFTEIYVADYDSKYTGKVNENDEDPFIRSGHFYSTKECFKFFRKEHREALLWYLKSKNQQDTITIESYIGNYFKNKKLLKKISNNPEISKKDVEDIIKLIIKEYNNLINGKDFKKLKEENKDSADEVFIPIIEFNFPDGQMVPVTVSLNEKEVSDAIACHDDKNGDFVALYPRFFKSSKSNQIFTLLHEFGHIRLHHLEMKNSKKDIFGNDKYLDHRIKLMSKGRVMYSEVNADLYAVLHGASLYSIMGSYFKKDSDKEYDYRYTNEELANRYREVFRKYVKLRGYGEKVGLSTYDIACNTLCKSIERTDILTESEKEEMYAILYHKCIYDKIKDNQKYIESVNNYHNSINEYNTIMETGTHVSDEERYKLENKVYNKYTTVMFERAKAFDDITNITETRSTIVSDIFLTEMMNTLDNMINDLKERNRDIVDERRNHFISIFESLSASERKKIPIYKFGVPETRSFPLDTKKHVHSAIMLFGKSDPKYRDELADRIFKAMEEYNISTDIIGEKSQLYKYLNK